jgi:hypothetical protein
MVSWLPAAFCFGVKKIEKTQRIPVEDEHEVGSLKKPLR